MARAFALDPFGDPDGDHSTNEEEVAAKSNPFNPALFPKDTILNLRKGFNLVSFPAETLYYEDLMNFMKEFGGGSVISRVLVLDL